jgi:hypothetical protein
MGIRYIPSLGVKTFLELEDTPNSYTNQSNKVVRVKGTEDGLEFGTIDLWTFETIAANEDAVQANIERWTTLTSPVKVKEIRANSDWDRIRIYFEIHKDFYEYQAYARVYKNGQPWGQVHTSGNNQYESRIEDFINIQKNDLIQLYIWCAWGYGSYIRNFRIRFRVIAKNLSNPNKSFNFSPSAFLDLAMVTLN